MLPSSPQLLLRPQPKIIGAANPFAQGVLFAGASPDFMTFAGPMAGAAASNRLLVSFWFRVNGAAGDGQFQIIFEGASQKGLNIYKDNLNKINVSCFDNSFAALGCTSSTAFSSSLAPGWHHVFASFDNTSTSSGSGTLGGMFIDGVSDVATFNQAFATPMLFAQAEQLNIGARGAGTLPVYMDIAALYVNFGAFLDPSTPANIQKFRKTTGHPEDLGANGSTPTGSQPILFLDNPPSTFQNNLGSGGNWTVAGGAFAASSSPP